jgi:hypothetical protein
VWGLALLGSGCGDAEAQDPIAIEAADLPCADGDAASWQSAQWPPFSTEGCAWLAFDGRTSYRIAHELGRTPRSVQLYLAFGADGRSSAPTAGDPTRIVSVTDTHVELRNGTNQDFFLKMVLQ